LSIAINIVQGAFGRVALLDMDKPLVVHAHHHCHILIKASGSDAYFDVRGDLQPLTRDSAVLINAWEPHAYAHRASTGPRTIILALYIECPWLERLHRQLAVAQHPRFFPAPCVRLPLSVRARADALAAALLAGDELPAEALENDLAELVIPLLDPYSEWRNASRLYRHHVPNPLDARVARAIDYLRVHVGDAACVDDLASRACLSRAHFFALFRRSTNLTPGLYMNVLRMEAAIGGLSADETAIAALSQRLGFSAQSHFTRFFRQHLGITPTDYRRKTRVLAHAAAHAQAAAPAQG
jgi:AraC-like DNA-binding protein